MRGARVLAESKDPVEVGSIRIASGNSHRDSRVGRTPCDIAGADRGTGVLRLRDCFASRTSCFAQDDSFDNLHDPRPEPRA